MRSTPKLLAFLSATLPSVLAAGCLVSFDDYPKGDLRLDGTSAGASGGGGGSSSTAGGGGKGGSVATAGSGGMPTSLELMIDDFEDGNVTILPVGDRIGTWYKGNDDSEQGFQLPYQNTGLVELLDPPRGASERALHTSGRDFDEWGALVRADFKVQAGVAQTYDISMHAGVTLWLRSGDERTYRARVQIATPGATDGCTVCGDHFGTTFDVTPDWQQVTAPFAAMVQEGYGMPQLQALTLDEALGIQVSFGRGEDFDVWVDDIGFY